MENIKGGFHIISNVLEVRVPLPICFAEDMRFDKATPEQTPRIRDQLRTMSMFSSPSSYYEFDWTEIRTSESSVQFQSTPLPEDKWRYYVLAFSGYGNQAYDFLSAANLVQPALTSFSNVLTDSEWGVGNVSGWGGDPMRAIVTYEVPHTHKLEIVDADVVDQIKRSFSKWLQLDKIQHEGIARAVNTLISINRIPRLNDLRVLSLFAILEMLLTHNPNDKEIGDSLSHQISTKVLLLAKRFVIPLKYDCFGLDAHESTIWKKLYEYRSKIAHGEHIDFTGKLQVLKNREIALAFLEMAIRKVVRHALDEPQLVDSLKPI
jgi:Apea-like HEPN